MPVAPVSSRMLAVAEEMRAVIAFAQRVLEGHGLGPDACDFMFGNPQEPPLRGLVEALIRHTEPRDVHWFGYQKYDPAAREAVARSLRQSYGRPYEPADVAITAGGFGAIAAALLAVLEVGEEVLYPRPGWFAYGAVTRGAAGTPVPVDLTPGSFDLNVEAIAGAIGPRTRVVVVNTPTTRPGGSTPARSSMSLLGCSLPPRSVTARSSTCSPMSHTRGWSSTATRTSARQRAIRTRSSPTPTARRCSLPVSGWAGLRLARTCRRPTAPRCARRWTWRNFRTAGLSPGGPYGARCQIWKGSASTSPPCSGGATTWSRGCGRQATMYRTRKAPSTSSHAPPMPDDAAFAARLAAEDVWVLPGSVTELPGRLRISLTATDAMVERALPVFARAIREVKG